MYDYEQTKQNALYCVKDKEIKGMIAYKHNKPDKVFIKEIKVIEDVFDENNLEYEVIPVYEKKYGFGYSFIIKRN